jgi:hypothetical protein
MNSDAPSPDGLRLRRVYRSWFKRQARANVGPRLLATLARHDKTPAFGAVLAALTRTTAHFNDTEQDAARAQLQDLLRDLLPAAEAAVEAQRLLGFQPSLPALVPCSAVPQSNTGDPPQRADNLCSDSSGAFLEETPGAPASRRSTEMAARKRVPDHVVTNLQPLEPDRPPCLCGCGGTPRGTKSRFIPGHDARYHAAIKLAAKAKEATKEPTEVAGPAKARSRRSRATELPSVSSGDKL